MATTLGIPVRASGLPSRTMLPSRYRGRLPPSMAKAQAETPCMDLMIGFLDCYMDNDFTAGRCLSKLAGYRKCMADSTRHLRKDSTSYHMQRVMREQGL